MADRYPVIEEAAEEVYGCVSDDLIRMRIEAREDYERRQQSFLMRMAEQEAKLTEQETKLTEQEADLAEKNAQIEDLKRRLAEAGLQ